ncbi:MAG: ABC-F family ATP-binding cassette domain-containing protein [Proteobacteria bacterium]|nr:ABC-F family ATP-binding cassette domain-containing protein [Pseudomonadota bacterium]MDA1356360.1 ABC-F family ATP-binding cassette domain-containing protein [Pseudomonadota bacterium]
MAPPLLILRDINLRFGAEPLLEGAELSVSEGERLCLVGRNGCGKSTLLKIAAGTVEADTGERFVQPGATLRYLPQEPNLSGFATVLAAVESDLGPGDDVHRARTLVERLGLTGDEDPAHLSGGETRRAALARALAPSPDILLLDEPTNHLDLPAIEWLENELKSMRGALVLVSHDRRFLENLSRATVWLSDGAIHRIDRGFAEFEPWRDDFIERRESERHKLKRKIAAETMWLHKGVTARRKRNQGRLRALMSLRKQQSEQRAQAGNVNLEASQAASSGKLVIEGKHLTKSYAGVPVIEDLSVRIPRGARIGIVGPNGAGKTTLINLLCGTLTPDSGTIRLGANLQMATLDQKRDQLDSHATLQDALTSGGGEMISVNGKARHVVSYMKDFLFLPEQARTPVSVLSGGERGRLMIARALARPSNLLVLDEPTNDLDLETLDLLQETLAEYGGTVLLVSHDRDFLDRVATSVIAWEGSGKWLEYAGGYSDMLVQRRGAAAPVRRGVELHKSKRQAGSTLAPIAGAAPSQVKLSYKDKFALDNLPKRIATLQDEIKAHNKALADGGLFAREPDAFTAAVSGLKQAEAALAAAEDQWLTLELAREEAESA